MNRSVREITAELVGTGLTPDQIALVTELAVAAGAAAARTGGRSKHAEAQARYEAKKRSELIISDQNDHSDQNDQRPPSPPSNGSPTPLPITTPSTPTSVPAARTPADDGWPADHFDRFWEIYPNRIGKQAAAKALEHVRRLRVVDFTELIAGLRRYVAKTDDRPWCNPATWLNQHRWTDEPPKETPNGQRSHHPPRRSGADDFFAGLAEVAADLDRDGQLAEPADADLPAGGPIIEH
jgi:hypothetical protein